MTKREAALILGLRESAAEEKVKDAHRRIMVANHPDAGGSSYIAAKVGLGEVLGRGAAPCRARSALAHLHARTWAVCECRAACPAARPHAGQRGQGHAAREAEEQQFHVLI